MGLFRPVRRLVLVIVVLPIAVAAAGIATLWVERDLATSLPPPSGRYAVGRRLYEWRDSTPDPLAPVAGTTRDLLVWVWYPAVRTSIAPPAPYLPGLLRSAVERDRGPVIGGLLTRNLAKINAHCLDSPPVDPSGVPYPIVLLRGGASAGVWNYTTLAEDLASHGYVVVGLDAPYRTNEVVFPDGRYYRRSPGNSLDNVAADPNQSTLTRLLDAWVSDLRYALDRLAVLDASDPDFKDRLDLAHIGVMGHSFGGAQAAELCHADSRCRAAIDIDGLLLTKTISHGVHRPFLLILSDHHRDAEPEMKRVLTDLQSVYARLPSGARTWIDIRGANHFLFSDDGALLKSRLLLSVLRRLGVVGIDGRRQLVITADCIRSFFDAELKQGPHAPLRTIAACYPEVSFGPP